MTEEMWRPIVPTATSRGEALSEAFSGVLRESLFRWLQSHFNVTGQHASVEKFVDFQNASGIDLGFKTGYALNWRDTVLPRLRKVPDGEFTNLIDFMASQSYWSHGSEHPLESILSNGGSAWTVVRWSRTHARLTKRVPDGVQKATAMALAGSDLASRKLQEAWLDAYGTTPRASVAYSNAVVAVETAALSVIPAGVPEPTLANLFSILEAETPKWRLVFRDSDKAPGGKSLAAMLRVLWRGHSSRHGHPDYADASLEEARAAVILAATLVQWFNSGVVVPVKAATV